MVLKQISTDKCYKQTLGLIDEATAFPSLDNLKKLFLFHLYLQGFLVGHAVLEVPEPLVIPKRIESKQNQMRAGPEKVNGNHSTVNFK